MKTYHKIHVVLLWAVVAVGIALLPTTLFAEACGVTGYSSLSMECLSGTHPEQVQKRQHEEQLRVQKETLYEQQRQTQIMRNNLNNQRNNLGNQPFNSYGAY